MFVESNRSLMIKAHTLRWVKSFVMALNVCPFAKHVVEQELLHIEIIEPENVDAALLDLIRMFNKLDHGLMTETVLLVLGSELLNNFDVYLDFYEYAEVWLEQHGYSGIYQLATFHPDYCFAGVQPDDVGNFTNRSPYPMLHILRESSLDQAIKYYGDTANIPDENIQHLQRLGVKKIQQLLDRISQSE